MYKYIRINVYDIRVSEECEINTKTLHPDLIINVNKATVIKQQRKCENKNKKFPFYFFFCFCFYYH